MHHSYLITLSDSELFAWTLQSDQVAYALIPILYPVHSFCTLNLFVGRFAYPCHYHPALKLRSGDVAGDFVSWWLAVGVLRPTCA